MADKLTASQLTCNANSPHLEYAQPTVPFHHFKPIDDCNADVTDGRAANDNIENIEATHAQAHCGRSFAGAYDPTMFIKRAYAERESLSDHDLGRLHASLVDQVQRYEAAIRGYSPDKMEKHARPFLAGLRQKVADVDAVLSMRGNGS